MHLTSHSVLSLSNEDAEPERRALSLNTWTENSTGIGVKVPGKSTYGMRRFVASARWNGDAILLVA